MITLNQLNQSVYQSIENYHHRSSPQTDWREPLLGVARVDDPLFRELKHVVSPSHAHPRDFLPDAKSVLAFFLPFKNTLSKTNIRGINASREWAVAYVETNELIKRISEDFKILLEEQRYSTFIFPATHNFDEEKLISDWSHRHIAYIAGLGTFGLNNMLITQQGCCGRVGSLVSEIELEPTPRSDVEFCRYKNDGSCVQCVERCPVSALTVDGFDRRRCYEVCLENDRVYPDLPLTDVCGKCVVGIPCAHTSPVKISAASIEL